MGMRTTTRTRHRPLAIFAEQERSRYKGEVSGGYASINTCVPASTRSKRSMTSAFLIRMQPWECVFRSKVKKPATGSLPDTIQPVYTMKKNGFPDQFP